MPPIEILNGSTSVTFRMKWKETMDGWMDGEKKISSTENKSTLNTLVAIKFCVRCKLFGFSERKSMGYAERKQKNMKYYTLKVPTFSYSNDLNHKKIL